MNSEANYRIDAHVSCEEYDAFVTSQTACNLLQSSAWANVKKTWDSRRTVLRDDSGKIVAAALILIRPLALGYTMWYVPHGPILDYFDESCGKIVSAYLAEMKRVAKNAQCVFIKIDPPVALKAAMKEELPEKYDSHALNIKECIENSGFHHQGFTDSMHDTLQPRITTATMRPAGEKRLLEVVPKRTRRFVKDAVNRYVQVRRCGIEELNDFVAVVEKTEEAKGVHLRGLEYFENLMHSYGDNAMLHMAYIDLESALKKYEEKVENLRDRLENLPHNAQQKRRESEQQIASALKQIQFLTTRVEAGDKSVMPIAGCLSVRYGRGLEMLYAGFDRNYSKITAQDLVYATQMQEAFDEGVEYCCIGGVSNSLDDGLMEFKSHFSPLVIEKLGEFDCPIRPVMYRAVRWVLRHR